MSDIFDRSPLLAAAPIQARWDDTLWVPLLAAPCLEPLQRATYVPFREGP
ncbi:MAG: hypothetical protein L3K10_02965 [Thermoplasmata archaeon]|nr:hypothetical protein [Thermoplasmata archaeon]